MSFLQQLDYTKTLMIPGLILGFTFHEYAHAKVATIFGDNTPVYEGRLTLNPVRHVDILGLVCFIFFGFGWAKPVHIDTSKMKNKRLGEACVSFAGPLTNLVLAFIFTIINIIFVIYATKAEVPTNVAKVIYDMINISCFYNCAMFVFNMIPIPPFDGFHVFVSLFPEKIGYKLNILSNKIGAISFIILIIILNFNSNIIGIPVAYIFSFFSNIKDAFLGL